VGFIVKVMTGGKFRCTNLMSSGNEPFFAENSTDTARLWFPAFQKRIKRIPEQLRK
jgi:hypothetical protein